MDRDCSENGLQKYRDSRSLAEARDWGITLTQRSEQTPVLAIQRQHQPSRRPEPPLGACRPIRLRYDRRFPG